MLKLVGFAKAHLHDDRGATMIEYGLVAALIAVVVVPLLVVLGPMVAALYGGVVGGP
jgi:pilus assembly protein Flp/PilA